MSEAGDERVEAPRRWVAEFHDSEPEVRGVLDDVREQHLLGEHEEVRERLRAFAAAEDGIFRLVALAVLDVDAFYEDLAAQYDDGEAPTEELRALASAYGRLEEEFELVLSEQMNELRNPRPSLRRGFRYSPSTNMPRLDYDVYSGAVKLCQFVHPPSHALMLARAIVASTTELLERVEENDDEVAEYERERLAAVHEDLADAVAAMDDLVADPDADDAEADIYEDWSFY